MAPRLSETRREQLSRRSRRGRLALLKRTIKSNGVAIAMNSVREGYVTHPQFYPYTGFLLDLEWPPCRGGHAVAAPLELERRIEFSGRERSHEAAPQATPPT